MFLTYVARLWHHVAMIGDRGCYLELAVYLDGASHPLQLKFLASAACALTSCDDQSGLDRLTLQQLPELAAGG
jgi:hypothetical protein